MTHALDTDHISIWERPASREYPTLLANMNRHNDSDIGVSVVSYQEQTLGINTSIHRGKTRSELLRAFASLYRIIDTFRAFPLLAFDDAALAICEGLKYRKIRIGTPDLRIAAIALANNLILVTRSRTDLARCRTSASKTGPAKARLRAPRSYGSQLPCPSSHRDR